VWDDPLAAGDEGMSEKDWEAVDYGQEVDQVYDRLGGADWLYEWAQMSPDNMKEFVKLIAKRLPNEVVGESGGPILIQLKQL
jgi:hypothetical protein